MQEDSPAKIEVTLKTKIALILFGLFLFFVLLETGLRLGGFIVLSMQEHRNSQAIKQKDAYRIMCLGESTTASQYPAFLEEILNQRNIGIRFSVIDKGLPSTTTSDILGMLESNINNYHPDMVVTMMGINDSGEHIPYETATISKTLLWFKSFRTYKLIRLLWLHILTKDKGIWLCKPNEESGRFEKIQIHFSGIGLKEAYAESISTEDSLKKFIELNPGKYRAYIELGWFYRDQGKFSQAEDFFKKAVKLNPKNDRAYNELGRLYRDQDKFSQAEDLFKKLIELNPKNYRAYTELGWLYLNQGKFSQAEDSLKKAVELNPKNDRVYNELGWLYRDQGKFSQAEDSLKKAVELNPKNDRAYNELGRLYRDQDKFSQAEDLFKKLIELNHKNDYAYIELGRLYRDQGKFSQAEDLFKKAIELNPKNDSTYRAILALYEEIGKPELAKEYAKKANIARSGYYKPVTVNNYRKLKYILDKRGIRLVCVQYPMRSIEPLKKIFGDNVKGVFFVNNEKIFRDAVKKGSSRVYFSDMFGGDFGHCTGKGNRLLAENIANTIIKEVFRK